MTRRAALATALACSVGAPLTAAAPADAGMQTLRSSCARQDAADGSLANGARLPIVFCDDGVPHAGGTTPNAGLYLTDQMITVNPPYQMIVGSTYHIEQRRDATMFGCTATTTGATQMATLTSTINNTPNQVGIYVLGATIQFHWVMVVSNP